MMETTALHSFSRSNQIDAEVNGAGKTPTALNLRSVLAELGHRLIEEHGFQPANLHGCSALMNHTLEPLVRFLVWLEHTPEAGFVLQQMGIWHLEPLRAELRRLNLEDQERNPHERASRQPRGAQRTRT